MEKVLKNCPQPYLTTDYLLGLFHSYKSPRDKIKKLNQDGDLIHVKQGLYLLGPDYDRTYSLEVMAGMIYGPSCISFEYALSYHGLIPEKVQTITCLCFKRDKNFKTVIGEFNYKYIAKEKYYIGIEYHQTENGNFFIASKEKAICDMVFKEKLSNNNETFEYLCKFLRIEEDELLKLDITLLISIAELYKRKSVDQVISTLIKNKR